MGLVETAAGGTCNKTHVRNKMKNDDKIKK